MKKKTQILLIPAAALLALLGAFLAGACAYKLGYLSEVKRILLQPSPQPTETVQVIQPDFSFELLDDPTGAAMNDKALPENETPLKFLVAGHIYGKPGEDAFHPSPNLINNVSLLDKLDADFMVFLGDTVWKPTEENFDVLAALVLDPLDMPVFNAVGNHDVTKRDIYQERFGSTVFAFQYKQQLFLFLDTTLKYYDLTEDEYTFIRDVIQERSPEITTIHIFMHHVLFLEEEEILSKPLLKPNEADGNSPAFLEFVNSELVPVSATTPIYIYAGDVGAFEIGNLSPFYKKMPQANITFLATGLGGNQFDSILILDTAPDNSLIIQPFSLTGREMGKIEDYSLEEWSKR